MRLAAQVATLDRPAWLAELTELCGNGPGARAAEGPPDYRALVRTGLEVVTQLADDERWRAARMQAAHMADYFTDIRRQLHPVASVAFQGLCDAAQARDRDDLDEHADFLREIFLGGEAAQ